MIRWAAVGLAALAVFEATCRVEDWVMYRMPLASRYRTIEDLLVHDADGVHPGPNGQFEKWITNGVGTRGPEAAVVPPAGTIRVITVGASETFGLLESPNHEYPRRMQDSLNATPVASCGGVQQRFEVLNAAFAGMTVPTIDQDVRNRLRRLQPAVIFAYPSPLAYLEDRRPTAARPDSSGRPTAPSAYGAWFPRSLDRVREQAKSMLPGWIASWLRARQTARVARDHGPGWQFLSPPADRLAAYDADLRHLVGTIRAVGAIPVLGTHADLFVDRSKIDENALVAWEKIFPRATGRTLIAFDSLSRLVTLAIGRDSGAVVADVESRLARAPAAAFADAVHFTDLGAALVAGVARNAVARAAASDSCRVTRSP